MQAGQFIAEALFRVFDQDESGNLNFSEFLQVRPSDCPSVPPPLTSHLSTQANSVRNLDTPQDKLGWMVTFVFK